MSYYVMLFHLMVHLLVQNGRFDAVRARWRVWLLKWKYIMSPYYDILLCHRTFFFLFYLSIEFVIDLALELFVGKGGFWKRSQVMVMHV